MARVRSIIRVEREVRRGFLLVLVLEEENFVESLFIDLCCPRLVVLLRVAAAVAHVLCDVITRGVFPSN